MRYLLAAIAGFVAGAVAVIAMDAAAEIPNNVWERPLTRDGRSCCSRGYGACRGAS